MTIENLVQPVYGEPLVIQSLDNGRWIFNKDMDLIDTKLHRIYVRDKTVPLDRVVFTDVEDMVAGPISLIFLYAIATRPFKYIDQVVVLDPAFGLKVELSTTEFNGKWASHVHWVWPKDGLPFAGYSGEFCHVPGADDFIVSKEGIVRQVSTDKIITPGTNARGIINIVDNLGKEQEVHVSYLVALAYGMFNYTNIDTELLYIDGNSENYALSNLLLSLLTVEGQSREAVDDNELRLGDTSL